MSSIEAVPSLGTGESATALAHVFFDEVIAPAAGQGTADYFALAGEPEQTTYFVQPSAPQLASGDFDFPGGGDADSLIDALIDYWTKRGDSRLVTSGPRLKEIIAALREEGVESDGDVDPYCYTMF